MHFAKVGTLLCVAQLDLQEANIHRSMQHTTGIRINAGLSLPSSTACVAGFLGVGKAPQLLRGGLTGPPSVSAFHMLQLQTSHQKS